MRVRLSINSERLWLAWFIERLAVFLIRLAHRLLPKPTRPLDRITIEQRNRP